MFASPAYASAGAASGGAAGFLVSVFPLVLIFVIFYFLLIRPQQKRQREIDNLLKSLKRGDMVRTSGGIRGEIVDLTDQEATLLIADKVKINILRSHVASKMTGDAPKEKT